jgi:two-component system, response regulator PdtaR
MNPLKVLVVEDDRMLCQVFELFLKNSGYEFVGFAHDSTHALKLCVEKEPDVVLMDIHITGNFNGVETARMLGDRFHLPVIFVSSTETISIQEAILENTYGFIRKPTDQQTLATHIEFAYRKHKYMKEKYK